MSTSSVLVAAEPSTHIVSQGAYRITVADAKASRFDARELLGTHSLWWGYQSDLWIPGSTNSYPTVNTFFKKSGGLIRYGGGANEIPWQACSAPIADRTPVKAVSWAEPMKCLFGVPEYLSTVRANGGGGAWLIANIAGVDFQIYGLNEMLLSVGQAATSLRATGADLDRYWELGNELERGRYGWSPETIAARASAAAQEILQRDPLARLVLPLIEYNDPNQPPRTVFNQRLLTSMTQPVSRLALHLYYDGAPGGPSVPTQLNTITETAALYRQVHGQPSAIWITEHGRWPEGLPGALNWQDSWYKTNDMDGVLGTADFLIALTQIEDVAGAMLHGLRAGPWNVFDKAPRGS